MEFKVGDIVKHASSEEFGEGRIVNIEHSSGFVVIEFENYTGFSYEGVKKEYGWKTVPLNLIFIRRGEEDKTVGVKWYRDGKLIKTFEQFENIDPYGEEDWDEGENKFKIGDRVTIKAGYNRGETATVINIKKHTFMDGKKEWVCLLSFDIHENDYLAVRTLWKLQSNLEKIV
jgi:transcription antitermination factor NusG